MGKESFEDKIRQQLEGYEAPYDKSYWKKYARSYPAPQMGFWKTWWMPYVFSSLLFGTAWFWFGRDAQPLSTIEVLRDTLVVNQTIVTRDTLVVRDTVVLVWDGRLVTDNGRRTTGDGRIIVQPTAVSGQQSDSNQPVADSRTPPFGSAQGPAERGQRSAVSSQRSAVSDLQSTGNQEVADSRQPIAEREKPNAESGQRLAVSDQPFGSAQGPPFGSAQGPAKGNQAAADGQEPIAERGKPTAESRMPNAESGTPTAEEVAAQIDSIEKAAIADIPTEPESKMRDAGIFVSAGPRLTSLSPLSYGNFDTRFGTFVGGAVQVDWHKWQLEMGLQYGFQLNELDELGLVPLERRQAFPGYSALSSAPEEVGVISEHLLIPLQARFTIYDYRSWRLHVAGGALGNAVLGETFVYDKENVDRDRWERTVAGRGGLSLSHLNAGIGTSYQWRQNLELQAILNYYHPLRPLGLNRLEAGALSLQLGLNWLLLPR